MIKTRSTKQALLMSALALLLCVSMFIGSTFAWFTDSVTSGSNVIQAGTLDIVMEYWDGDSWEDAEGKVLEFIKGGNYHGYTGEVLWEPGCTYELPKIRVRNEGNLAAKVLLKVNGITGNEKLLDVIDFTTKVNNIPASLKTGSAGVQFSGMEGKSYGLIYGTSDGTVMMDWTVMAKGQTSLNTGHTDTSAEFTISGHMKEEASNEYQGLKIEGVSITALATQEVYEYDSFGREYDKNATLPEVTVSEATVVADADALAEALANGDNVVLADDVELSSTLMANKDAVIDLNGKTITAPSNSAMFQSQSNAAPSMTITSSVDGAEINVTGGDTAVLLGYGSTEIKNVTINVTGCDNASPNPFKAFGDLTLGEGTVVNVDYLGTALISNNGAHAIVIDGAQINVGTFKTNGTAIITLNNASTLEMKNTVINIDNFVLSSFGGDSLVSKVEGVTIEDCTFDVTDSNAVKCTFVAKDGKYRLEQK